MNLKDILYTAAIALSISLSVCLGLRNAHGTMELAERVSPVVNAYDYGFTYFNLNYRAKQAVDDYINRLEYCEKRIKAYDLFLDVPPEVQ